MTVRLAPGVQRLGPGLLLGGDPLRVLRLSAGGAAALDRLLAGGDEPELQRRLQGLLLAGPGPSQAADVTVVVPVRGTGSDVVRAGVPAGVPVVVVDDGSPSPVAGATVRHRVRRGPAAARAAGAALARTGLVAFVDADVTLPAGWLDRLSGHFADPRVVAVAPRVVSGPGRGLAGVLEHDLCALDRGPLAGEVRRGSALSYVPSTVLLVRRSALAAVGGFDPSLHVGEDVDLVWRLLRTGTVRYDPDVVAVHAPRTSLRAALRRRYDYGTSAGELDRRHPGQVRHLTVSVWSLLPWAAALVHPVAAPVVTAALVARGPRALPAVPAADARRLVLAGQRSALAATGRYAVRPALPLTVAAALASRRVRRLLPALAAAYALAVVPDVRGPRTAVLRVAEDLAYGAGVWSGCLRSGRWRPLVPGTRA